MPSCVPDPTLGLGGAFRPTPVGYIPTIMDRLDAAALTWRLHTAPKTSLGSYVWATCPSFAECLDTSQAKNMVPTDQILIDARNGSLPNLSLVLPGGKGDPMSGGASQHNGMSMARGDNWIGRVVTALEHGPEWSSTALFIAYDDCGCFYDHVPPGVNADGTAQGPRIPLVIVSPYARPHFTDSIRTTVAGILAYVEQNFGLPPLSRNDAASYAFAHAFDYSQTPLSGPRMVQSALPPASAALPLSAGASSLDPT